MELVLSGMDWEHCMVYLDDICLFSPTFEHHIDLLERVFLKLCLVSVNCFVIKWFILDTW